MMTVAQVFRARSTRATQAVELRAFKRLVRATGAVLISVASSAAARGSEITLIDLGVLPRGTFSSGLAINNEPVIVGVANDNRFEWQRPFWDANTGDIVGFAENMNPASVAIPEHLNDLREMAGTEMYGDNVYQGVYWNPAGEAFLLPPMAGADPDYASLHTKAHGLNNIGQIVGSCKEGEPNFYTHAVLWPDKDTEAIDLGFLGQGNPLDHSIAYGVNDVSHVVGVSALGSLTRAFLWRSGEMIDLGTLSGQIVSEAYAINNTGVIVGRSNFVPVIWQYDVADPDSRPTIQELPIPEGFFTAVPTAVNDIGDVVGYAGSPNIDAHAILWRAGNAIDLGVWPGGHYSVANGINDIGQVVGTGTVAADNLDHALMWMTLPVTCTADLNHDAVVDGADLGEMLANWGMCAAPEDCPADLAPAGGDDVVDAADLGVLLANWGICAVR
jgi:probable HAF family extracellular repeat protein